MNKRDVFTTCKVCRKRVAIFYPTGTHPARGFPHVAHHFHPGSGKCSGGGAMLEPPAGASVAPVAGGTMQPPKSATDFLRNVRLLQQDLGERLAAVLNPRRQPASALPMNHWTPQACAGALNNTAELMRTNPVPGAQAITRESARMHEAAVRYLHRWAAIEELTRDPEDSLRIFGEDPDHPSERASLEVCGEWTLGELLRYDAETIDDVLALAVKGRRDWEAQQ